MSSDEPSRSPAPSIAPTDSPDSRSPPAPDQYPILVVEDDESTRILVVRLLTANGYSAQSAASFSEAMTKVAKLKSPILVVDKNMPGKTGLELISDLREARDDFEAVLMTAHADVDSLVRGVALGVFRCVTKPFSVSEMLTAVAGAANRLFLRLDLRARKRELEARNAELEASILQLRELESRRRLSERMASLGQFAAGLAHEINNPLTYTILNLTMIDEIVVGLESTIPREIAADLRQLIADARDGANRLSGIVRDVKTFSRGDDDVATVVDVQAIVRSSLRMAGNEMRHRARVVTKFDPTPNVTANASRLGQVVLNLVVNAVQSIPEGAAEQNEIRVATRTDSLGRAVIEVQDSGAGIPKDQLDRVFDPFFTTKAVGVGTGLGLFICHGIVSALGGTIEVESEVGLGALFRIVLPPGASPPPGPVTSRSPMVAAQRTRVLIIDDEPGLLSSLRRTLSREHHVTALSSGHDALTKIRAGERFDAILCDVMMPAMSGMEFHAALIAAAPELRARIIFMTGGAFTPLARAFIDRLTTPHIEKPFDQEAIRALVATVIATSAR